KVSDSAAWSNHRPWLKPLSAFSRKVDASIVCRLPAIIRNRFLGSEIRTFPIRPRNQFHEQSSVLTVRRIHPRTRPTGQNRRLSVGQTQYALFRRLAACGASLDSRNEKDYII